MILSKEFKFGNGQDEYPITGYITDSIFETVTATGVAYGTQLYTTNIEQGQRSLNYGNAFTPTIGDKIRVDFLNPLIIQNA